MKWIVGVLLVLAACSAPVAEQAFFADVENVSGEILFSDVLLDRIPSDEIVFFGVRLGDYEERVRELHGEPDEVSEFSFGAIRNLEYGFGQENVTAVLYHVQRGVVSAVLVTDDANEWLVGETVMSGNRSRVFGLLGTPSSAQDLHLERAFIYDSLGYTVFVNAQGVDRIYFSRPTAVDEVCAQVITPAVNERGLCVEFATPCDVPSGWDVVDSCEGYDTLADDSPNRPPVIEI